MTLAFIVCLIAVLVADLHELLNRSRRRDVVRQWGVSSRDRR